MASRIGVLGGGQLGRMLALAGYPLGLRFLFLDPAPGSPVSELAEQVVADYDDREALASLAACDVVTYEFESVPVEATEAFLETVPVYPPPGALRVAQDRLFEKQRFRSLGIPTPDFAPVDSRAALTAACDRLGFPAVLKTRRFGYDGKGQRVLRSAAELDGAWEELGGAPLILEEFVLFDRELSIVGVRGRDGDTAFYPLVENVHEHGILRVSRAPAPNLHEELRFLAEAYCRSLLEDLEYVGVLALELFQRGQALFANEMAPRVHNTGHFSIEGARTSQFENHLRAILGLPLGSTEVPEPCCMLNLIGAIPERTAVLSVPGAHLHLYGKAPRAGRKVGHITVVAPDRLQLDERVARLSSLPGVGPTAR
ncbi:MAG TPA: 5-(carboxyamino)imidazole ribonucleotide synthase [Polyangiaceae bacterium]